MPTRLNKYISESGICSRREADRFIEQGSVLVNGKKAKIGDQVSAKDRVIVNGNLIEPREDEDIVYIVFNKPPGVVSTTEPGVKGNIIRAIKHSVRLFPIGGLDKELQGLIMLTSDGELVNRLLRGGNAFEKEYVVMVDKPLSEQFIDSMREGMALGSSTQTEPCEVRKETPYIFRITLRQELNHQLQRMCEQFGYEITQAERIRVMNIPLKGIGIGEWRELKEKEMQTLLAAAESAPSSSSRRRPTARPQDAWSARPPRNAGAGSAAPTPRPGRKAPTTTSPTPEGSPPRRAAAKPASQGPARAEGKPVRKTTRPGGPGAAGRPAAPAKGRPSSRGTRGASRGGKRG